MVSLLASLIGILHRPNHRSRKNKYGLPLPTVCHQVIDETEIDGRNVFVIGDVHGCLDEMNELLTNAREVGDDLVIIFAGDMINKGPKSVEVIRQIRKMPNTFAVRGNHEEAVLREVRNLKQDTKYDIPNRYNWIQALNEDDIDYINELPYTISVPSLKIHIVHGGIVPGRPLELQNLNDLTNMRNVIDISEPFFSDFLCASNKVIRGQAWAKVWDGPYHVYFGHDARRSLQMEQFATGLDTGCVYGNKLTGVFANGCKKLLSVQAFSSDYKSD